MDLDVDFERHGSDLEDWEYMFVISSDKTDVDKKRWKELTGRSVDSYRMIWDCMQGVFTKEETGLKPNPKLESFLLRNSFLASDMFIRDCGEAIIKKYLNENNKGNLTKLVGRNIQ